jgi:hypothetical protein
MAQLWVDHSDLGVQVMRVCERRGVTIRVATQKLIAEEAPESYKDVSQVQSHHDVLLHSQANHMYGVFLGLTGAAAATVVPGRQVCIQPSRLIAVAALRLHSCWQG